MEEKVLVAKELPRSKKEINQREKRLAKSLGGKVQPASGALDSFKGDINVGEFLIDDKSTVKASQPVTKKMLQKITKEAREAGKLPVLSLSFDGMGLAGDTWFLVPKHVFQDYCLKSD